MVKLSITLTAILFACFLSFNLKPQAQAQAQGALAEEAKQVAQDYWKKKVTQCGDSFYTRFNVSGDIGEFKGGSIELRSDPLGEAERLNGYQYSGVTTFKFRVYRIFSAKTSRWGDWTSDNAFLFNRRVIKYRGSWKVEDNDPGYMSFMMCVDAAHPEDYIRRRREEATAAEQRNHTNLVTAGVEEFRAQASRYGLYANNIPAEMWVPLYRAVAECEWSPVYHKLVGCKESEELFGRNLRNVLLTYHGGWVVQSNGENTWNGLPGHIFKKYVWSGVPFPDDLPNIVYEKKETENIEFGAGAQSYVIERALDTVAPDDAMVFFHVNQDSGGHRDRGYFTIDVPPNLFSEMRKVYDDGKRTYLVRFAPNNAWIMCYGEDGFQRFSNQACSWSDGLPENILSELRKTDSDAPISEIAFTPDGGWVIIYGDNGFASNGLPQGTIDALNALHDRGWKIRKVTFGSNDRWLVWGTKH
jgi:hypothetical protein